MNNTGGPAFPHEYKYGDGTAQRCDGMTLRDYFAAKAMQNQISNPLKLGDDEAHRLIAERSFRMADAMLKERLQK